MGSYSSSGMGSKGVSYSSSNRRSSSNSPLKQLISMLEELEQSRQTVEMKERELEEAKRDMEVVAKKVKTRLDNMDPTTKDLIRDMLDLVDGKIDDNLTQGNLRGRNR